ncbi:hypothetical protein F4777DRAFT_568696 [Nemania sp. FL0916]|nr:hypothetical protein F4777DRAFT_568696 [Nemania sp. FL0916]
MAHTQSSTRQGEAKPAIPPTGTEQSANRARGESSEKHTTAATLSFSPVMLPENPSVPEEEARPVILAETQQRITQPNNRLPIVQSPIRPDLLSSLLQPKIHNLTRGTEIKGKYERLQKDFETAKRNFDDVSHTQDNEIKSSKRFKKSGPDDAEQQKRIIIKAIDAKCDAYLESLTAIQDILAELLRQLAKDYTSGTLTCTKDDYDSQFEGLSKHLYAVGRRMLVTRSAGFTIRGSMVDAIIAGSAPLQLILDGEVDNQELARWAYIEHIMCRFTTPPSATFSLRNQPRDEAAQRRFRTAVFKAYGADWQPQDGLDEPMIPIWCVVSGSFWPSIMMTAARIVGFNLGKVAADHIFGTPDKTLKDGHLMSPQNGLPMRKEYAEMLDRGEIVFEAVGNSGKDWEIVVLDEGLRTKEAESTMAAEGIEQSWVPTGVGLLGRGSQDLEYHKYWSTPSGKELHGRRLRFFNDFRPSTQYTYFTYCLNILRRQRLEVPGWWNDSRFLNSKALWAGSHQNLRRSTMATIAQFIGLLDEAEAKAIQKAFPAPENDSDVDVARRNDLVTAAMLEGLTGGTDKKDSNVDGTGDTFLTEEEEEEDYEL